MRLSDLKPGQTGVITKILGHGAFRKRVMEMGFVRGREVSVILNAPLQDPVKYALMGYEVSLRRAEANLVEVELLEDWNASATHADNACDIKECDTCDTGEKRLRKDKIINIALIGNPNCGKTSLFNMVSGAHEHVGNYAGVTVGAKEGSLKYKGYRLNIVDLPGTYSLSAYSPEELYVMRYLREETPDVIVNVIVASNLERNLYLTTELIDMNLPMVIDLNMYDELQKGNAKLDYKSLGKMLGVPFVPTIASTGWGIDKLLDTVIEVYEMKNPDTRHIHVSMNPEIEQAVSGLNQEFKPDHTVTEHFSPRFLAIKFMERDPEIENMLKDNANYPRWAAMRDKEDARIQEQLNEDVTSAISADKYGFIQGALRETMEGSLDKEEKSTKIIDAFVTNKLFGFPIFLIAMWVMFWATFQLGSYPMEWIENLVGWISEKIGEYMTDGPLKDLLLDGVIGGVGGVIVFLPNILILYAFISFMEDSGYMARAQDGTARQIFHSSGHGFRMQRPSHNVHTNHRKQIKQTYNDPYKSIYQLFGPNTYLCAFGRSFLSATWRMDICRSVSPRSHNSGPYRQIASQILVQSRRDTLCNGVTTIPYADFQGHHAQHVGKSGTVSEKNGRTDPRGINHHLGTLLFPALLFRRRTRDIPHGSHGRHARINTCRQ